MDKSIAGSGFAPGKAVGDSSLSGAVETLKEQHPQKWSDRGPHHEQVGKISRGGKLSSSGG